MYYLYHKIQEDVRSIQFIFPEDKYFECELYRKTFGLLCAYIPDKTTLFNISASSYNLWKSQQFYYGKPLTVEDLQKAMELAVNNGKY